MDDLEPLDDLPAKIALAETLGDSELGNEAFGPKERTGGQAFCSPEAPHQPDVQVQVAGRIRQRSQYVQIDRNAMRVDFLVKGFAENKDDFITRLRKRSSLVLVEPKLKAIEKVKSRPVEDEFTFRFIVASEKDDGREDALESLHDAAVPFTLREEAEKVEHLGGSAKSHNPASLANRKRRHPDWNEAILAEGQSELGMSKDLKEEPSNAF